MIIRASSDILRINGGVACAPENGLVIHDHKGTLVTDRRRDLVRMFKKHGPSNLLIDSDPIHLTSGPAFRIR